MSNLNAADEYKRQIEQGFKAIADTYDSLRFLKLSTGRLMEQVSLSEGMRVLDIGTGTGLAAVAAARLAGRSGRVVGVDISVDMLAHARRNAAMAGVSQIEFRLEDAQQLTLPDNSFDLVLSAAVLFFVPDMLAAVGEARRVLVPGGCLAISSFGSGMLEPLLGVWIARLAAHGAKPASIPIRRLADPKVCRELLVEAGFSRVEIISEPLGYYHPDSQSRWAEIVGGLEGLALNQFSTAERDQIRAEHLAELDARATREGLWVNIPTNFVFGWK